MAVTNFANTVMAVTGAQRKFVHSYRLFAIRGMVEFINRDHRR
jgi:hypothetical protein